jgi:hypothetical protein
MASIFEDSPPAWLTQIARPVNAEGSGELIGTILGAGMLAMQSDPKKVANNTDPETGDPDKTGVAGWAATRKGFQQGMAEARMSSQDPQWRLKEAELKANLTGKWADTQSKWQSFEMTSQDNATYSTKDLPALREWQEKLKTDPDATPPVMESTRGQSQVAQIDRAMLAVQNQKMKAANAKNVLERQKRMQSFEDAKASLDPYYISQIDSINGPGVEHGWNVDQNHNPMSPNEAALKILNDGLEQQKKPRFGLPASVAAAEIREKGAGERAKAHEEGLVARQKEREQARKDQLELKHKYDVDVLKMRLDHDDKKAAGKGGKTMSEDDWVKSNIKAVFTEFAKKESDIRVALRDADRALRSRYRADHPEPAAKPAEKPGPDGYISTDEGPKDINLPAKPYRGDSPGPVNLPAKPNTSGQSPQEQNLSDPLGILK